MPFQPASSPIMRTERVSLSSSSFIDSDLDSNDSADIVTQAYVEKYSAVITPTAFMKLYGVRATLIVEYIIKTDPGTGTVDVQTLVDGADAVEKTGLTIASGKQTAVHTDILEVPLKAGTSYTVSLEAKNSDAGQTSVIDYCNMYLQLGTKSTEQVEILRITGIPSLRFDIDKIKAKVWSAAVNTITFRMGKDEYISQTGLHQVGSDIEMIRYTDPSEMHLGTVADYVSVTTLTSLATDPAVINLLTYHRVWLE